MSRPERAWRVLETVPDPEVPALSVCDLGIVRGVHERDAEGELPGVASVLEVVLTPTYSGCPATEWIERSIVEALQQAGLGPVRVRLQRAPAWTTDWISAEGRRKMLQAGIVPPAPVHEAPADPDAPAGSNAGAGPDPDARTGTAGTGIVIRPLRWQPRAAPASLPCPRCASLNTERLAAFGSTACKALHRCLACGEPFEHFKPL